MTKQFTEVIYKKKQIDARIKEIAKFINQNYQNSKGLIMIGILKGSAVFLVNLMLKVKLDLMIDFITVNSFENDRSTNKVNLIMDLKIDIENKDVILVEDIFDSGLTLNYVYQHLLRKKPHSLKLIVLFDKPNAVKKFKVKVDIIGFKLPDKFVVGYGMDYNQKFRNLPDISVLNLEKKP